MAVERPNNLDPNDLTGTEDMGPEDTGEADFGRLLESAYERNHAEGSTSPKRTCRGHAKIRIGSSASSTALRKMN